MVKWYSRLLTGIFIPSYLVSMQTIKQEQLFINPIRK